MIIFDGKQFASQKEEQLTQRVRDLSGKTDKHPKVGCLVFFEDQGGLVYSQEKKMVAQRLGIEYVIVQTSLSESLENLQNLVKKFAEDVSITGIIIQKPWRKTWQSFHEPLADMDGFTSWWHSLTSLIPIQKDIDGLHPETLQSIKVNTWRNEGKVLPATCRAVISILESVSQQLNTSFIQKNTLIVGKSELLGIPLTNELRNMGWEHVQLVGQKDLKKLLETPQKLHDFDVIVSSTGVHNLITGEMVKNDVVLIDVGFPQGDIDFHSIQDKASFITPVPNGVGPVTVISLLENTIDLCYNSRS
jgi:methylenetetrahydrofolate dehydrogenase (NADP+)/methenyltetrahydrofolate cyclohydrolase